MIAVVKFKAEHLIGLDANGEAKRMAEFTSEMEARALEGAHSYSVLEGKRVMACCGVMPLWKGRGYAWAMVSKSCGHAFIELHRAVLRFLDTCPFDRIEAAVDVDFKEGHRWMKLLGFKCEAERARKFSPDGRDASLYARVRG